MIFEDFSRWGIFHRALMSRLNKCCVVSNNIEQHEYSTQLNAPHQKEITFLKYLFVDDSEGKNWYGSGISKNYWVGFSIPDRHCPYPLLMFLFIYVA